MAFSENIMEHARYAEGRFTYYAEIICDTAADIPNPAEHPNWEAGSKLMVLENGGSQYRLSNAREWVQVNFNQSGEGGDSNSALLRTQSVKVYVSASGSDDNDGLSASTAFATLGRALQATAAYGMTEISAAAGEYDFPSTSYYIYNRDLRITGAGSDQTTLYGKLYAHHSNLELTGLTLDGSKNSNTGSAPLTVAHGATARVDNSVVNAPTSGNGIYVTAMGHLFVNSSEINGFSTRMLYLTIDAEAVLSGVTCTTDSTTENIMAGATSFLRMVECPNVTYTTQYAGIVFVDGVQRSPVDISTLANASGMDISAVTSSLTMENENDTPETATI